jgi:hypothetical protein
LTLGWMARSDSADMGDVITAAHLAHGGGSLE